MSRLSLRVYFVEDASGLLTGRLIERTEARDDYLASGASEGEVLARLSSRIDAGAATMERLEPFAWHEPLHMERVVVDVRPQALLGKRMVIGKQRIPIELHFAWAALTGEQPDGTPAGYRVMLPRFGFAFVLEDLRMAAEVLRQMVSAALAGESARSLFEFREAAREYVLEWAPRFRKARRKQAVVGETFEVLSSVAEDWNEQARAGKLGTHLGVPDEARYTELLQASVKPSLLLVGPSGVGKTAWVKELARRAARTRTQDSETRIWSTSADRIVAGQVYLGMWEQRCLEMISELSGEGHYLFVDRVVDLVRTRSGASSIADLFQPALADNQMSMIAECTSEELERLQSRHASFLACFQIVRLMPPEREEVCALIADYAARNLPELQLTPEAIRRLVRHLQAFRKAHAFPGSVLTFLAWLAQRESTAQRAAKPVTGLEPPRRVEPTQADRLFSEYSGLGLKLIGDSERAAASSIAAALEQRVVGQSTACERAAQILARFKAGVNDPEKPIGSLLFIGPTGVGKTELAKEIARYLFGAVDRLVRLDMSEFMLPSSTVRLLSDDRGASSLVQRVSQEPLSLVLFDEIEKAHPAVFDLLLALLGEGRLTSSAGRTVDFRMTLVVMTSNLGSESSRVGFGEASTELQPYTGAVRAHFRPEFVNRLDNIVPFAALTGPALRRIVELLLREVVEREGLRRRNLRLSVSDEAKDQLARLGTDSRYGARPLKRVIEERIVTPVAVELSRRPGIRDARIRVALEGSSIQVRIEA